MSGPHDDNIELDDDNAVEKLIQRGKSNNGNPAIATKTLNLLVSLGSGPIWYSKLFVAPVPWTYDGSKIINEDLGWRPKTSLSYLMREVLIRFIATLFITAVAAITFFMIPNTIASHPIAGFPPESTIIVGIAVISFGFLHGVSSIVSFMWSGTYQSEKEALIAASVLASVPILIVFPAVWVLWILTSVPLHGFVYIIGHLFQIGSLERRTYTYIHESLIE